MKQVHRFRMVLLLCIGILAGWCVLDIKGEKEDWDFVQIHYLQNTAPGLMHYYASRLYGNPHVNIDRKLDAALEEIRRNENGRLKTTVVPEWQSIGPSNFAGRIRALVFDPSDSKTLYAGSASGGVFKSTDEGKSWKAVMDSGPSLPIGALAIHPQYPQTIFAGTGESTVPLPKAAGAPVFTGVGILKSTNGGATWEKLPWPFEASAISRIQLHPESSDTMLVSTRQNLWKTTDGGATWTNVLSGVISDVVYHQGDASTVFAAIGDDYGSSKNGVYRSDAGGDRYSWIAVSENFPQADSTGRIILAATLADSDLLLAFIARKIQEDDFLALMKSIDGGKTWERQIGSLPSDFPLQQAFYNFCAAISPTDPNDVYAGGLDVWRSTNGGRQFWRLTFGNGEVHVDQHVIAFQPGTGDVFVGNDGGVYRYQPNERPIPKWTALGATLETVQFYSLAIDNKRPGRVFGGTQDNGILRLESESERKWLSIRGDSDGGALVLDSNWLYSMVTTLRYPFRSSNGGQAWMAMNNGLGPENRSNWLQPLALHPTDRTRLYTATQFVHLARDANNPSINPAWIVISPDLTTRSRPYESIITTMAIPKTNGDWMYVGTGDGKIHRTENLNDSSPQWTDISSGIPSRWISRLTVSPRDHRIAYAVVSGYGAGHIFQTTNGGMKWNDITGNLPDIPVNAIIISPLDGKTLFIATDAGVWFSRDDGVLWERYGMKLPLVVVYDLVLDSANEFIAATHGRGAWVADAVLGLRSPPVEPSFKVEVFPHPVQDESLTFKISTASDVSVELYSLVGDRIVYSPMQGQTKDQVIVSISNLNPGVYYYRVSDGRQSRTGKIVTLK